MINSVNSIIQPLQPLFEEPKSNQSEELGAGVPTFLDVFKNIAGQAASTQEQKTQDMLDLMLGDVDDLAVIQANITKAQISMELLVNVTNAAMGAYNEIIKMTV